MRTRSSYIAGACCLALFVFAFVAAPYSCEWGSNAYFSLGVLCGLALFSLPFALHDGKSPATRIGFACALAGAACITWIAGLFVADVRIMCRLF